MYTEQSSRQHQNTFFPSVDETFSRIDMSDHKTSHTLQKFEIIQNISSIHNSVKLEINNKQNLKFTTLWKLRSHS